jgi:hypothetical protein
MYNLSQHYENIYNYLRTIIADPRVAYLHPFGATQPENLEIIRNDTESSTITQRGPLFIFHDQEPLDVNYNQNLFKWITNNTKGPWILVNTEQTSQDKDLILKQFPFADIDYFFHIFAAHDWYRGHQYNPGIVAPANRQLKKTYITFNRLTSKMRVYRSLLVNELYKNNLLEQGYVSYSKDCPEGGMFDKNLLASITDYKLDPAVVNEAITNISQLPDLRIDFANDAYIPNQSMVLSPIDRLMESFIFLVTETCFFQTKTHLTEKIFKPIVLRMPFVLAGCAHNLEYLRGYGFRTFADYWDESYDTIEDPVLRLQAIAQVLKGLEGQDLHTMLLDMQPILEHNYNLFNDHKFVEREWNKLTGDLTEMSKNYDYTPPFELADTRLWQIKRDPT